MSLDFNKRIYSGKRLKPAFESYITRLLRKVFKQKFKECMSTVMLCIVIVYILPGKFTVEQKIGKKNLSLLRFR